MATRQNHHRHQQHQRAAPQDATTGAAAAATAQPAQQAALPAAALQFDSNMDWPTATSPSNRSDGSHHLKTAESEARHPPNFPAATIGPCARITTRIYNPKYDRIETVRDVLVEVVGPGRDADGRPIPVVANHSSGNANRPNGSGAGGRSAGGHRQAGGKRTVTGTRASTGTNHGQPPVAHIQQPRQPQPQPQPRPQQPSFDTGAGFTGAGGQEHEFLIGPAAIHHGQPNPAALVSATTAGDAMAEEDGDDDDDDSMSSGWSTSDSEMSDVGGTSAASGDGGGTDGNNNNNSNSAPGASSASGHPTSGGAHHHHHHHASSSSSHQTHQPPQRAYWLQRTLREAIYGRVRYGVVLKRRSVASTQHHQPQLHQQQVEDRTRSWNEPFVSRAGQPVAEWEVTEEKCAVKEMSWQHIRKEKDRLAEDPVKEVSCMQYLKRYLAQCRGSATSLDSFADMLSTHIMLPLDLLSDDRYLYSVMPFCDGGELFDRLDNRSKFSEEEARYWMVQILDGLDNLQRAGICHRDMSLENLLVHKDRLCMIIDMGMCLRIPYEGSREDGEDLFYPQGGGDEDEDEHDGNKRPRTLSASTELRQSFMSMDLDRSSGNLGNDGGIGGGGGGPIQNGVVAAAAAAAAADAKGKQKCCPDIRQRHRYLIKPDGTCGKWHYMSPEIAQNKVPFDGHAVDVWATGVILFLMLTGFPPWERPCRTDERFKYMTAGYLVQMLTEWELGLSPDAMDLLQRMLWIDPRDRLSLAQVRAHPWMRNGRAALPLEQQQGMMQMR